MAGLASVTGAPPDHPPAVGRLECEVALTSAEVSRLTSASLNWSAAKNRPLSNWWLLAAAAGAGFLSTALYVLKHVVEPEDAAGVAFGGFVLFWAGSWLQYARQRRTTRRMAQEISARYYVKMDADGMTFGSSGRAVRVAWWRVVLADVADDIVRVWIDYGALVGIPSRFLPGEWTPASLVAHVTASARASRSREADLVLTE